MELIIVHIHDCNQPWHRINNQPICARFGFGCNTLYMHRTLEPIAQPCRNSAIHRCALRPVPITAQVCPSAIHSYIITAYQSSITCSSLTSFGLTSPGTAALRAASCAAFSSAKSSLLSALPNSFVYTHISHVLLLMVKQVKRAGRGASTTICIGIGQAWGCEASQDKQNMRTCKRYAYVCILNICMSHGSFR